MSSANHRPAVLRLKQATPLIWRSWIMPKRYEEGHFAPDRLFQ